MISLGRINLFYSRDETMKFLCLGHASNVNLFVSVQFSVVAFLGSLYIQKDKGL